MNPSPKRSSMFDESSRKRFKSGPTDINNIDGTKSVVSIVGRIIDKREPREFVNQNGTGKVSSILVMDKTGKVEITFFNDNCDKFLKNLKEDHIYSFSKLRPSVIKDLKFKKGTINFQLNIGYDSTITEEIENDQDIPLKTIDVQAFSVLNSKLGDYVNVIGIVIQCSDVSEAKTFKKRDIKLVDSNHTVDLTLWQENAIASSNINVGDVITVEQTKVSSFQQRIQLSGGKITQYQDKEIHDKLKKWFEENEDKLLPHVKRNDDWEKYLSLKEAKSDTSLHNEFFTVASILNLYTEDPTYKACKKCHKKKVELTCKQCPDDDDDYILQMMSKVQLSDYSDSNLTVTMFNNVMETVLDLKSEEMKQRIHEDEIVYDLRIDEDIDHALKWAQYQQWGFWIRKTKNLLNINESQFTVISAEKVNYESYLLHLKKVAAKRGISVTSELISS